MKKLITSFILFIALFNGTFNYTHSNTKLYDSNEATIEIDSARLNSEDLQVSWSISGIENIDQVTLSVREITSDGLLGDPTEFVDNSSEAIKIIPWDGTTNLSLTLKILTTEKDYVKLSEIDRKEIDFLEINLKFKNEDNFVNYIKLKLNENS